MATPYARAIAAAWAAWAALAARGAGAEPLPVVEGDGQLAVRAALEVTLAPGQVARPLSLAPDAWWGVTPELTLGVIDSTASLDRVDAGASVCIRTDPSLCPHAYHGSGLDARYLVWTGGGFAVAPRVRLLARDLDPWKPAATLGALATWRGAGRWSLATDPYVQIGLANTDLGNRSALVVPLYVTARLACRWALDFETGYASDLAVWRDGYHVPVALDVLAHATAHVDLGIQGGLTSLLGPQNDVKQRELWLFASWR